MDLVRKILITLADHEHGFAPQRPLAIEGYDSETIGYHVYLMGQGRGDLLEVLDDTRQGAKTPSAIPAIITWQGHEFLDNAQNDTVWNRVKAVVRERGGSVSFEVLKELVTRAAKKHMLGDDGLP